MPLQYNINYYTFCNYVYIYIYLVLEIWHFFRSMIIGSLSFLTMEQTQRILLLTQHVMIYNHLWFWYKIISLFINIHMYLNIILIIKTKHLIISYVYIIKYFYSFWSFHNKNYVYMYFNVRRNLLSKQKLQYLFFSNCNFHPLEN